MLSLFILGGVGAAGGNPTHFNSLGQHTLSYQYNSNPAAVSGHHHFKNTMLMNDDINQRAPFGQTATMQLNNHYQTNNNPLNISGSGLDPVNMSHCSQSSYNGSPKAASHISKS